MMFGEQAAPDPDLVELQGQVEARPPKRRAPGRPGARAGRARGGRARRRDRRLNGVSLDVRPGEILGVAGVDGNGQRELAEAIAGQRPAAAGDIRFRGVSIARLSVRQREGLGLRYVSDDRLGEGTVAAAVGRAQPRPQADRPGAVLAARHHPAARGGAQRAREDRRVRRSGRRAPRTRVGTLSGGNVQKVVLARELAARPAAGGLQQADLRPRHPHHPDRPGPHQRAGRRGRRARWSSRPTWTSWSRSATGSRCSAAGASRGSSRAAPAPSSASAS